MLNLGWFSTGRGPGSRALLSTVQEAITDGRIQARISFVFSNRAPGEAEGSDQFFALANFLGLTVVHLSSKVFRRQWTGNPSHWRTAYDREVADLISPFSPDLCVLAGYMLIVSPDLCRDLRMVNLHPAAPNGPDGTWQEVIWKLIEQRADHSGVKIHLVTEELDRGPTIAYCRYPIHSPAFDDLWRDAELASVDSLRQRYGEELPLFKAIRREGVKRELPLLIETLAALSRGELQITPDNPTPPLDFTAKLDPAIKQT